MARMEITVSDSVDIVKTAKVAIMSVECVPKAVVQAMILQMIVLAKLVNLFMHVAC